ncbi:hypothetical protein [Escherichia albertii]|uniref:hypothetical protein n=1 Tax=Escherichia albertii TaxID=208962 RepID=UPI001F408B94|nr:hypothetical protein [Escherichia albertii]
MVGDPHQQIYRFRGAVDALNSPSLATADRLWLTGSFFRSLCGRCGKCRAGSGRGDEKSLWAWR